MDLSKQRDVADPPPERGAPRQTWAARTVVSILLLGGLYALSRQNFLVFHGVVEFLSIAVAWSVFLVVWNARSVVRNDALLLLGTAYFFVGLFDLVHTLSYQGMGILPVASEPNAASQLWLVARGLEALGLLAFGLTLGRRVHGGLVFLVGTVVSAAFMLSILAWDVFPDGFVEGKGLTPFKIGAEYVICLLLAGTMALLTARRHLLDPGVYRLVLAAMAVTIASELSFTLYEDLYGPANVAGHLLKIVSFFLVYLALVSSSLKRPYSTLFRELELERRAHHESEERLRTLINAMPDIICFKDGKGRWLEANRYDLELFGLDGVEYRGKTDIELAEFTPFYREALRTCVDTDEAAWQAGVVSRADETIPRPDGTELVFDIIKVPTFHPDGSRKGLVVVGRDVTARRQAERRLESEKERLGTILSAMDIGLVILNRDFSVAWVNARIRQMFPKDDPVGRICYEFFEETGRPCEPCAVKRCFETGLTTTTENCNQATGRWYLSIAHPLRDETGQVTQALESVVDITDMKRAQEELHELESRLRHSQKLEAVGQLAGGLAHDFNNILTAILGNLELSMDDVRSTSGEGSDTLRSLDAMREAVGRASSLTRQLLTFSRRDIARPEVVDLNQVIERMEPMLRRLITENIRLETVVAPALHPVLIDANQFEQVVMNLTVNAVQAMPDGGTLTIAIRNAGGGGSGTNLSPSKSDGPGVVLTVRDTGLGMDAETRERLFEPFFTTKSPGKGTGLGLATVHGIVTRADGWIEVDSAPGAGSEFRVFLPACEGTPASTATAEAVEVPKGHGELVLVCEDDRPVRELAARMLRSAGYEVLVAENGAQGLGLAEACERPIDLLLTDVIMPDLNGREVAQRVRAIHPRVAPVFISGYDRSVISHHGELDEGIDFIAKPFTRDELLTRVREVLDRRTGTA